MEDALRTVGNGGCEARPLPGDPTCAGIARRTYRRVAEGLALEPSLIDDGVTIVSELAANTLHVRKEDSQGEPELWLYLRGSGINRELVCKVFDTYPGWLNGTPSGSVQVSSEALHGRGLGVVHELSGGHWGYHLTRGRLGSEPVRGKAVWFALPVPEPAVALVPRQAGSVETRAAAGLEAGHAEAALEARTVRASDGEAPVLFPVPETAKRAREAMEQLEAGLAARGFGGMLVRADDGAADMAVLSVCGGITLWCADGAAWLRAPGSDGRRWGYGDLVELTEQTVEAYETTAGGTEIPQPAARLCVGA